MSPFRIALTLPILAFVSSLPCEAQTPQMIPAMESSIHGWTNAARQQRGRAPLSHNAQLARAAQMQAYAMAVRETMAHTIDGVTLGDRVRWVGYQHAGVGENVAFNFGYSNPEWHLFQSWMTSEGHYRNIMNEQFAEMGVGVAQSATGKIYACQVLGRSASMAPVMVYSPSVAMPIWSAPRYDFGWYGPMFE